MTTPTPTWALKPTESYRTIPGELQTPAAPMNWKQLQLQTKLWLDVFIGKVAIAFGAISIFGWKPLDFLADWGQKRIDDAVANYQAAMNAQSSANYANTQITVLTGGALASDVTGGVSISSQFEGGSSNDLGSNFTLAWSDGAGAGNFGLNGSGRAVWKKSGGGTRQKFFIHNTPLATDYQAVFTIIGAKAQNTPTFGDDALTYLIARSDSSGSQFVYAAIGPDNIRIGRYASTWNEWDSVGITVNIGDQFVLIAGTSGSLDEFIIKQNGIARMTKTGSASTGLYYVGLGAKATPRSLFTDQTAPAELDMWSAADRQPTTA